jgi:hypothetical protein
MLAKPSDQNEPRKAVHVLHSPCNIDYLHYFPIKEHWHPVYKVAQSFLSTGLVLPTEKLLLEKAHCQIRAEGKKGKYWLSWQQQGGGTSRSSTDRA